MMLIALPARLLFLLTASVLISAGIVLAQEGETDLEEPIRAVLPPLQRNAQACENSLITYTAETKAGEGLADYFRRNREIDLFFGRESTLSPYGRAKEGQVISSREYQVFTSPGRSWVRITERPSDESTAPMTKAFGREDDRTFFYRSDQDAIFIDAETTPGPETLFTEYLTKFLFLPDSTPRPDRLLTGFLQETPKAPANERQVEDNGKTITITHINHTKSGDSPVDIRHEYVFQKGTSPTLISQAIDWLYPTTGVREQVANIEFLDYREVAPGVSFPGRIVARSYASIPLGLDRWTLEKPATAKEVRTYPLFTTTLSLKEAKFTDLPKQSFIDTFAKTATTITDTKTEQTHTHGEKPAAN